MLSNRKWAPLASWITGWLTLVGNWTVTTSICFSGGQLILSSITLWREDWAPNSWQTVLMFWAVMTVCALVNVFCSRYLDFINNLCIYWTSASVVVILIVLLSMADIRNSGKTVFTHYDASASGWTPGWAFFVGLLQAAYTLTGYGMVAAMCEEVQNPQHEVPKGMILSVVAAAFTGIIYLLPVLFTLPVEKIELLLQVPGGMPIGVFFKIVTGSPGGGFGLLFLLLGILMFAGIGALTAASRCTYAFARDGAIPFSKYWRAVDPKWETPIGGIALSTFVCCVLGLIFFGSSAAFNAFTGVATICLSASYALPVFVSVIQRREKLQNAPMKLGNVLGYTVNIVTIVWIFLATVLFCMPTAIPVTQQSMNYASVVFMGFSFISATWYVVWGRKHFNGPPTSESIGEEMRYDIEHVRSGKHDAVIEGIYVPVEEPAEYRKS